MAERRQCLVRPVTFALSVLALVSAVLALYRPTIPHMLAAGLLNAGAAWTLLA